MESTKNTKADDTSDAEMIIKEVHAILDSDESKNIRNEKDGDPEGRPHRELSLQERVRALCKYAADWKRWYDENNQK